MIKVTAFADVTKKLSEENQKWITITGNPGDGKTILGYLVLNFLKDEDVFVIDSHEDFDLLNKAKKKCTVMMNDPFGAFNLDSSSLSKWTTHIKDFFDQYDKSASSGQQVRVLFISRKSVLQSAKPQLERYGDKILKGKYCVDLSEYRHEDDRLKLLDLYLGTSVSDEKRKKVAGIKTPHGFPHCCKMYKDMESKNIDIVKFFTHPLEFLDETTRNLANRKACNDLFTHMIKSDGKLDAYDINDPNINDINKAIEELDGSYVKKTSEIINFTHPSIFESVVVVIGEMNATNKLWIVENASVSTIMQMVNIKEPDKDIVSGRVNIDPHPKILDALCERFRPELLNKKFSVIGHKFCENRAFCVKLIKTCVQGKKEAPDPGKVQN